jgi:hypothetical protein
MLRRASAGTALFLKGGAVIKESREMYKQVE